MSCEPFESLIALDAGGDLPAADAGRLASHLRGCAACRRFAADMRATRRSLAGLGDASIDEGALAAVRAGVLRAGMMRNGASRAERPAWARRALARRALALAAALAVSIGALLILRSSEPAPSPQVTALAAPPPPSSSRPATPVVKAPPVAASSEDASPKPPPAIPKAVTPEPPAIAATAPAVAAATPAAGTPAAEAEPMLIQLVSEDLVIYWIVEPPAEASKETKNEISTV